MKRPHSAKPIRTFIPQVINEDGYTIDQPARHFVKMGKKHLLSAASISNDLSRLLPKKIHHDKEQLYHENMQLKTNLNEINEENLRLKTKIALIQRQKDRMIKTTQNQALSKGKSSNNLNATAKNEKQNGIVSGLKKLVRQSREENENLKAEVAQLKKSIRYTKLNEIQIEKQTIYQQNKKLAKLVQKYEVELTNRIRQDDDVKNLQSELNEKIKTLKQVTSDNIRYQEILEEIQAQYQQTSEKLLIQEKKWQRNFAVEKRKYEQLNKHVQSLKNEVKNLSEKLEEEKKKNVQQKKQLRPASSHPYQNINSEGGGRNKDLKQKEEAMQVNSRLKLQLQQAKKKLFESQNKLKIAHKNVSNTLQISKDQTFELMLTKKQPSVIKNDQQQEEYGSDFEENVSKVPKQSNQLPIQQKSKNLNTNENKRSPIINEIKELLTYRMKYNRYTFKELKEDIEVSPDSSFIYEDLMNMLMSQPFYLTKFYAQQFLKVCFKKTKIFNDDQLALVDLVKNLRVVVDDFELNEQEEQQRMLYKIAENMTKNRKNLEAEFSKVKDKHSCITKTQLIKALKTISRISDEQIDLAICYISINIETLEAINYIDFLDRFYINQSKSLSMKNTSQLKEQDDLSMGENQNLDEGQLIADDELV